MTQSSVRTIELPDQPMPKTSAAITPAIIMPTFMTRSSEAVAPKTVILVLKRVDTL
jgi:hypothetical protein